MAPASSPSWQRAVLVVSSVVLTTAALYFARAVLIPLVLAIFLSFVLTPMVNALQHRGLGRIPAAILALLFTSLVVVAIGIAVVSQVEGLAAEIPKHKEVIIKKLTDLQESTRGSWWDAFNDTLTEIIERVRGSEPVSSPREVVVAVQQSSDYWQI